MPVDLSGGRHYDGKSARARAPWPCPNCGVVNSGPLVGGCSNCGSGKPPEAGVPGAAGPSYGGGLTRSEVTALIAEALKMAGVAATPAQVFPSEGDQEAQEEEQGVSALGEGPGESLRPVPVAPPPVEPLTLPEIDTSDPKVRFTIADALITWANVYDEESPNFDRARFLDPNAAQALALQIAPELEGHVVEPPPMDAAEAQQHVEVGEQHKREILSRLRAPNSK